MTNGNFMSEFFKSLLFLPRRIICALILIYQKTLSLDHGPLARFVTRPRCKYHPTCSQYAHQAINRFGIIKGIPLSIWRIMRCNPWSKGGFDPVPTKSSQS